ncbi:TPA: DUF3604 domain-containing protein [Candidatus Bathyarchaeota archaeon]|nr:DUF3604 domain-containing protein [Candidatus Bathyarchaeota archaeon]
MGQSEIRRNCYGWAEVEPKKPVKAGSYGTWKFTYTAGGYGIDNTGLLLICWRFAWDWGRPQTEDPEAENYLTVHTDSCADLKATYVFKGFRRPWYHTVRVEVFNGEICPGENITLVFGDTSGGSPGQRAPTAIGKCEWRVFVDCFQTRRFIPLSEYPNFKIVNDGAARLVVTLPTNAVAGMNSWVLVRVEDLWGNPVADYEGAIQFSFEKGEHWKGLPEEYTFTKSDGGVRRFENVIPPSPGIYFLRVLDKSGKFKSVSNPCICRTRHVKYRYLWGDLHGQSGEALGIGSALDYFRFARNVAALDFCCNQGNDFDISEDGWSQIRKATNIFNEPDRFVAFLGYEWSGNTSGGGDRNVIFLKDNEKIRRSSHANIDDLSDISSDCYPITDLFETFRGRNDVLVIPHVGGRFADLSFHDPELESVIEIYSGWGLFEWFLNEALAKGLKVGFVAGSDDHKGRPGASAPGAHIFGVYGGLTCVLAEDLTRKEIFKALKARRCYATSGKRIYLDVKCNGHMMGEEFTLREKPTFECYVIGTNGIETVEIFRFKPGEKEAESIYVHLINAEAPPSNRLKIIWRGLRQRYRYFQTVWDGYLTLSKGKILKAEGYAFDTPTEGITEKTERYVSWRSQTTGDEDGIILTIKAPPEARIHFKAKPCIFDVVWGDIEISPITFKAGGLGQEVTVRRLPEAEYPSEVVFSWTDQKPLKSGVYYVKVKQVDGAVAYSSPFYIRIKSG